VARTLNVAREPWGPPLPLRQHLVEGHHPALHVIAHVAVQEPRPGIVGDHVHRHHLRRRDRDHVGPPAAVEDDVPVPVCGVEIEPEPDCHQVPAHMLALGHGHHRQVAVLHAIDRVPEVHARESDGVGEIEASLLVHWDELVLVRALRIVGVMLDVVVEEPDGLRSFRRA